MSLCVCMFVGSVLSRFGEDIMFQLHVASVNGEYPFDDVSKYRGAGRPVF